MNLKERVMLGLKYGLLIVVFSSITNVLYYTATKFLGSMLPEDRSISIELELLEKVSQNTYILLFVILFLTVLGPFFEEGLFRWLPITIIRRFTKNKVAVWIVIVSSSVLFGLAHGEPLAMFVAGCSGLMLSHVFLRGGIISSWVAHSFINIVATALLLIQFYYK